MTRAAYLPHTLCWTAAGHSPVRCPRNAWPRVPDARLFKRSRRHRRGVRNGDPVPTKEVLRRTGQHYDLQALCGRRGDLDSGFRRCREVLRDAGSDNRTGQFAGDFLLLEPSDGLEPSTPSLPWRVRAAGGDRGTALVCRISLLTTCFRRQPHPGPGAPRRSLRTPRPVPKTCPQDLSPDDVGCAEVRSRRPWVRSSRTPAPAPSRDRVLRQGNDLRRRDDPYRSGLRPRLGEANEQLGLPRLAGPLARPAGAQRDHDPGVVTSACSTARRAVGRATGHVVNPALGAGRVDSRTSRVICSRSDDCPVQKGRPLSEPVGSARRPVNRVAFALLALLVVALLQAGEPTFAAPPAPSGQATAIGAGGAAASVDRVATKTAIDVLRLGGNAVDAAVTAAAVLGVVEPFSCGIGGGGFMTIYRAADRRVFTLDGRETAPGAFRRTASSTPPPGNRSRSQRL